MMHVARYGCFFRWVEEILRVVLQLAEELMGKMRMQLLALVEN